MNQRGLRTFTFAGVALALALAGAACSSTEQPTPTAVAPTATPTVATLATEAPPTAAPTETPLATFTPWPTLPPTASPTPYHTPAPKPTPTPGPTGPAAFCSSSANNQAFFLDAAKHLKFAVYCAQIPKGWALMSANYQLPKAGGWLTINYKSGSATLAVSEGAFCLGGVAACSPKDHTIGTASIGGLAGTLVGLASGDLAIYVHPSTTSAYQVIGHNVSQSAFVNMAAAFKVVPKL